MSYANIALYSSIIPEYDYDSNDDKNKECVSDKDPEAYKNALKQMLET